MWTFTSLACTRPLQGGSPAYPPQYGHNQEGYLSDGYDHLAGWEAQEDPSSAGVDAMWDDQGSGESLSSTAMLEKKHTILLTNAGILRNECAGVERDSG